MGTTIVLMRRTDIVIDDRVLASATKATRVMTAADAPTHTTKRLLRSDAFHGVRDMRTALHARPTRPTFAELCPGNCNGAGQCNPKTGVCTCDEHRLGDDCSQRKF